MVASALSGLHVLEVGEIAAGAFCARMFADFGADTVKFEPTQGDPGRQVAPPPFTWIIWPLM